MKSFLSYDLHCNEYIVKAIVTPNPLQEPEIFYTGHAAERDNTGFVNKTSALENCETSAVGRALAFAGYGGDQQFASNGADWYRKQFEEKIVNIYRMFFVIRNLKCFMCIIIFNF